MTSPITINSSTSNNKGNIADQKGNSRETSTEVSGNIIIDPLSPSPLLSPSSRREREATLSESSTGDYAQYNYNTGIDVQIEEDPSRDNHYDAIESNAYAYAKYGPDYAYADMQNQHGYATATTATESYQTINEGYGDGVKQGVYEAFATKQDTDGDDSRTDLY